MDMWLWILCWDGGALHRGALKCPPCHSALPVRLSSLDVVWQQEISFSRNLLLLFGLNFPLLNFISLPTATPCWPMWQHSNRYLKCYRVSQLLHLKSIPYHDIIYLQYAQICQDTLGPQRDWPIAWEFSFRLQSGGCCAPTLCYPHVSQGCRSGWSPAHSTSAHRPRAAAPELLRPSSISAKIHEAGSAATATI